MGSAISRRTTSGSSGLSGNQGNEGSSGTSGTSGSSGSSGSSGADVLDSMNLEDKTADYSPAAGNSGYMWMRNDNSSALVKATVKSATPTGTLNSYSEAYQDSYYPVAAEGSTTVLYSGQCISRSECYISSVKFYIRDGVSGTATAYLFATTGTVGSNAVPTGSALATSNGVSMSGGGSTALYEFTFASEYHHTGSTIAFIVGINAGDNSNYLRVYHDANSPGEAGNICYYVNGESPGWYSAARDNCYYLMGRTSLVTYAVKTFTLS
jgi:hypothetical protein